MKYKHHRIPINTDYISSSLMGNSSSTIERQESKINRFLSDPKRKEELKCNGKYSEAQIKGKLREIYHNDKRAYNSNHHITSGGIWRNKETYKFIICFLIWRNKETYDEFIRFKTPK